VNNTVSVYKMKFVNRHNEIKFIEETRKLSENKLFTLVIYGLRRVGKTRLILETLKNDDLYFFVNRNKNSESLLREYEEILKNKNIINKIENLNSWDLFFEILVERFKGVVVFDEFQNFLNVEPSIFGILQKFIDLNENKKNIMFVFLGSTIGMIKNIFENNKEPLYGRIKRKIFLKPFSFFETVKVCENLKIKDIEEIIKLYCVFGGFPRYYVAIEDENLIGKNFDEILNKFFLNQNAIFEEEVLNILSLEFGKRKGLYYDILTAIANGNTNVSKLSSYLNKKETLFTRHLNEMMKHFEIIGQEKQISGKKSSFFIQNPIINFWFRFFYKNLSLYQIRNESFINNLKRDLPIYFGKQFEYLCVEILNKLNSQRKLPFYFEKIGRQWGKFKGEIGKNNYEIDILAIDNRNKNSLFGECKWKKNVDGKRILKELQNKTKYVGLKESNKFYYLFAKSFKDKFKEENVILFDLKDIQKLLSSE
jgi:uncharacterized protein